jgi:hypothetical protein
VNVKIVYGYTKVFTDPEANTFILCGGDANDDEVVRMQITPLSLKDAKMIATSAQNLLSYARKQIARLEEPDAPVAP